MEVVLAEAARAAEALRIEQADFELRPVAAVLIGERDVDPADARRHIERMFLIRALVGSRHRAGKHDGDHASVGRGGRLLRGARRHERQCREHQRKNGDVDAHG
jgi:hypothetical protein